jgi:Tfp pilus assembly protein PilF
MTERETKPSNLARLQKTAASHPRSVECLSALGDAYADLRRWDEAIEAYKHAIALDATSSELRNSLGEVYELAGKTGEAEEAYRDATTLRASNATALFNLGSLCQSQHRTTEAIQAFEKCLKHASQKEERSAATEALARLFPERKDVVQICRRIRAANTSLLMLGALWLVLPGTVLEQIWGGTILAFAALSRKIAVPSVLVIYGIAWAWPGAMYGASALVGGGAWKLLLVIVAFALGLFYGNQYLKYRHLPLQKLYSAGAWPAGLAPPQDEIVFAERFAVVSALLAAIPVILLPTVIVLGVNLPVAANSAALQTSILAGTFGSICMAVLSLGLGCAALVSKTRRTPFAIMGVLTSLLVIGGWSLLLFAGAAAR